MNNNPMTIFSQMMQMGKNPQQIMQQSGMSPQQYVQQFAKQNNLDLQPMLQMLNQMGIKL